MQFSGSRTESIFGCEKIKLNISTPSLLNRCANLLTSMRFLTDIEQIWTNWNQFESVVSVLFHFSDFFIMSTSTVSENKKLIEIFQNNDINIFEFILSHPKVDKFINHDNIEYLQQLIVLHNIQHPKYG